MCRQPGFLGLETEILEYNIATCLPHANIQQDKSRQDAPRKDNPIRTRPHKDGPHQDGPHQDESPKHNPIRIIPPEWDFFFCTHIKRFKLDKAKSVRAGTWQAAGELLGGTQVMDAAAASPGRLLEDLQWQLKNQGDAAKGSPLLSSLPQPNPFMGFPFPKCSRIS